MSLERVREAARQGRLRPLDEHFARELQTLNREMGGADEPLLSLAAALLSARVGAGDVCMRLPGLAEAVSAIGGQGCEPAALEQALRACPVVGVAGEQAPLILDGERLYLGRYWHFEAGLAEALRQRAGAAADIDAEALRSPLQRLFPAREGEATDWQMVAAALAALRRFTVISGGPGTGKTHTVTAILALLIELAGEEPPRIALAAPTGKAAARLSESIRRAKPHIPCSDALRDAIPEQAQTLHRLLGIRPGRVEPRHHAGNPLALELLVLDEASMIDLPMMARVVAALPPEARLILLGDKDQLASVEAGSVFADISGPAPGEGYGTELLLQLAQATAQPLPLSPGDGGFQESIALLRRSYRFAGEEGIGRLASAINAGDTDAALALLGEGDSSLEWQNPDADNFSTELERLALAQFDEILAAEGPRQALERLGRFRILCALRGGPRGVEQVNRQLERSLRRHGRITPASGSAEHYAGRPIMISRNDYALGLFNGDIGILWPDPEAGGALRAWFVRADDTLQRVLPSRLPAHESAFAMTIHKSQGSEFEQVLLLLPSGGEGAASDILTRELLYTGLTRARQRAMLWADTDTLAKTIVSRVRRVSGLGDRLYSVCIPENL